MRAQILFAAVSALTISSVIAARSPGCAHGCMNDWDGSGCTWKDGWKCLCNNNTALDKVNSCISSSSDCNDADKDASYQAIAQLCADAGSTVTASPEAKFSATSGGKSWPTSWSGTSWGTSDWSSWVSAVSTGLPGAPTGWTGGSWGHGPGSQGADPSWTTKWSSGSGPWTTDGPRGGRSHGGPFGGAWGPWGSSGNWTSGAWTSWWESKGCPGSTWEGWTADGWKTNAPWTAWTACTATTTATSTYTSTVSGSTVTGVTYGIRVAQATGNDTEASGSGTAASARATSVQGNAAASTTIAMGSLAMALVVSLVLM
ncbi:uncharacterized protein K452DRAFT_360609 [Aplosporella prunicola CBS 121167]|uniref:CFEM domain-containing protein n=1 Tax=Aplosporella prunicola CBS 121167 TaxID=1176127 RepID=A0A6A6B5H5_9PEZI|nr:uncharacterized protein K452DRAFT_360609 [Aplosporella prunicola CBS 121167]KAF2139379.1 hypothetical protein K452DRAFT_360609 [Aplosporella prunicola CBS 121167]